LRALGSEMIEKFKEGFFKKFDAVKEKMGNLIPDWMKKFLKQSSPAERGVLDSQLWGSQAVDLFALGMADRLPSVTEQSDAITNTLSSGLQEIEAQTVTTVDRQNEAFRGFQTSGLSALQAVGVGWSAYQNQAQTTNLIIAKGVFNTANLMRDSLSSALSYMITRAKSATDAIKGFFVGLGKSILRIFTDIIANEAVNALLGVGASALGFSKGGLVPEDGLAAVQKGELIIDKGTVSGLAGKGISRFGPETQTTIKAAGTLLQGAGAGFFGNQLASLAFGVGGAGGSVGGAFGGGVGFALGGPLGAGVGSFIGTGIIGGLGKVFGGLFGGPRLSEDEKNFASLFKQFRPNFDDAFSALAFTRLRSSHTGSDAAGDALNAAVGRNLFPGTSFLRDNAGPEGVDALTIKGFKNLIASGALTRAEINSGLVNDLSVFLGKFGSGGMVPRGRSGFGFFEGDKDELVIPGKSGGGNPVLEKLDRLVSVVEEMGGDLRLTVVTPDGETIREETIEAIRTRSANGEEIVVNAG